MSAERWGRACGKVILVGEHFVLDGAEALAMPLPAFHAEVQWSASDAPLTLDSDNDLSDAAHADALAMLHAVAEQASIPPRGRVTVRSTVPLHRGFGSSAAFSVAALRAAMGWRSPSDDTVDLVSAARAVENVVHGSSSGLDPATAMGEGAVRFRDGVILERILPHTALHGAFWVLCDVGSAPSTATAIAGANAARARMGSDATSALVTRIGAATEHVVYGLRHGDLGRIATGMNDAADCLDAIDVVDGRMRAAMARARSAGALAAKQSGAGLGGAVLALASSAEIAEIIAQRHIDAGLPTWTLEIAP